MMNIKNREFLPTTTPSVHASTVEKWKDHFVYAWFGGSREGASDVSIYIYNLNNRKETIVIGNSDSIPRWNPILFSFQDTLYLFQKLGEFCDRWQTLIYDISNMDENTSTGKARGEAQFLPAGLNGPTKTKPIRAYTWSNRHQNILCGSSVETFYDWSTNIEQYEIKDKKWIIKDRSMPLYVEEKVVSAGSYGRLTLSKGVIQPALWHDKDGMTNLLMRSSSGLGKIYYAKLNRDNKVIIKPIPTDIDNPNSGIDVVSSNGMVYLICNPDKNLRLPLALLKIDDIVVSKSKDSVHLNVIENLEITKDVDCSIDVNTRELSYPYMILDEKDLLITYTYGRKRIEAVTVNIEA